MHKGPKEYASYILAADHDLDGLVTPEEIEEKFEYESPLAQGFKIIISQKELKKIEPFFKIISNYYFLKFRYF